MANLKKYDIDGRELGECSVDSSLVEAATNSQLVKDYIVAIRNNLRQWSASTQGRSEVNHSNKKPHPQKGTGRARQGRLSSPQYKGGGVVFGPKPKFNQHVRINRKERRSALRALLAEKIADNRVLVLDAKGLEAPKTKKMAEFLKQVNVTGRVLFLSEGAFSDVELDGAVQRVSVKSHAHKNLALSLRNLPKVAHDLVQNLNGYELCKAGTLVLTEAALGELQDWLSVSSKEEK